jgi:hypothetical protein
MASPRQTQDPSPSDRTDSPTGPEDAEDFPEESPDSPAMPDSDPGPPRVLRLRIAPWDVICTLTMLGALVLLATMTNWPARLFGFTSQICDDDTCGPVPFGLDFYIHPLVWGGLGAAIAAAVLGPFVSMLKGWYMSFWPALSLGMLLLSSVVGTVLVAFSQRYWR